MPKNNREPVDYTALKKIDYIFEDPVYDFSESTVVAKSRNLILSHGDLGTMEQKIILMALSQYRNNLDANVQNPLEFYIPVKTIKTYLNYKGNGIYEQIKASANRLTSHKIHISDDAAGKFVFWVPVPYCKVENNILKIRFDSDMSKQLNSFVGANVTEYLLSNFKNLQYRYSIRIYELCRYYKQDQDTPTFVDDLEMKSVRMKLDEFKLLVGVNTKSIADTKKPESDKNIEIIERYASVSSLRYNVLDPAIEEINQKTDLHIEYDLIKEGRKYTDIEFILCERSYYEDKLYEEKIYKDENTNIIDADYVELKANRVKAPAMTIDDDELFELIDACKEFLPSLKVTQLRELIIVSGYDIEKIKFAHKYLERAGIKDNLYSQLLNELS